MRRFAKHAAWTVVGALCAAGGLLGTVGILLLGWPPGAVGPVAVLLFVANGSIAARATLGKVALGASYLVSFMVLLLLLLAGLNNLTDGPVPPFAPDLRPFAIMLGSFVITYALMDLRRRRKSPLPPNV